MVLECIAMITDARNNEMKQENCGEVDELFENILSCLNICRRQVSESSSGIINDHSGRNDDEDIEEVPRLESSEAQAQTNAFVQATYIYLYRTFLDVPPRSVQTYVSKTLREVSTFFSSSKGNFSIWPAFIAAAEAYTEEDMAIAINWLNWMTNFGLGNRESLKAVLEEIWRRRDACSQQSGLDRGMIIIDWRKVMHELNCDVLII